MLSTKTIAVRMGPRVNSAFVSSQREETLNDRRRSVEKDFFSATPIFWEARKAGDVPCVFPLPARVDLTPYFDHFHFINILGSVSEWFSVVNQFLPVVMFLC